MNKRETYYMVAGRKRVESYEVALKLASEIFARTGVVVTIEKRGD